VLDPDVIMEVFEMPHGLRRATDMHVQSRRGVRGQVQVVCLAESVGLQKSGKPSTPGGISLKDVNGPAFQHAAEIPRRVPILTGCDLYRRGGAVAHET
jgi:hypothetical protein